eukprot:GGOE01041595.1.p1 GENE.GGOE01041595.1~~GGOE01041595.1.p1  ORF type:complete len:197 (-),score=33.56 GGOE01041595.1:279-869(-)
MFARVLHTLRTTQVGGVSLLATGEVVASFAVGYWVLPNLLQHYAWLAIVKGQSMEPTLNGSGALEYVLMNKTAIRDLRNVRRGEVYALVDPQDETQMIIKRVVGLYPDAIRTESRGLEAVPPGHCWIEGDNAKVAVDSNSYGSVPLGLVQAHVPCVVWPPRCWQWLARPIPPERYLTGPEGDDADFAMEEAGAPSQ